MVIYRNKKINLVTSLYLFFLSGCISTDIYNNETNSLLASKNSIEANKFLLKNKPSKKNQLLYLLDLGMTQHWNKQYQESNATLEMAKKYFDEQDTYSLSQLFSKMIINDNISEYTGNIAEEIYVHIFKALNYISLNKVDEAWVEVRQIDEKFDLLQRDYNYSDLIDNNILNSNKVLENHPFHNSALANWIGMLIYRSQGLMDDARIDYDNIKLAFNKQHELYPFKIPDLTDYDKPIPASHSRLNLIGFYGRTSLKSAKTFRIITIKDNVIIKSSAEDLNQLCLENWETIFWKDVNPNLDLKITLPILKARSNHVAYIEAQINNNAPIKLQKIESLDRISSKIFQYNQPIIYIRTLIRAFGKTLAIESGTEKMTENMDDIWKSLTKLSIGSLINLTEQADTRSTHYFPGNTAINEVVLPCGIHTLQFHYYDINGNLIKSDEPREIELKPDQLHLEQAVYLN